MEKEGEWGRGNTGGGFGGRNYRQITDRFPPDHTTGLHETGGKLKSEKWLRSVARHSGRSYKQMRVTILEFLDTDVFHLSAENCVSFLDPLIDFWDIDLPTFGMEIALNRKLTPGHSKRFSFSERDPDQPSGGEPGLNAFLKDASLSGNVTQEEIDFLKRLRLKGKRPTPLYFYRELQNLRDPLHFRNVVGRTVGSEV